MGKQHSSDYKPGRRGPAGSGSRPDRSNRPEGRGGYEPRGNSGSYGAPRGGAGRDNDRSAGRSEYTGSRPSFGQSNKFGGRPGAGDNRRNDTGGRSFGDRDRRNSFGDDARPPRRFEAGDGGERRSRDERGERPAYPPKPIWQGQPVRYEGKPTVPRGVAGERNRKFVKRNPDGSEATPSTERPRLDRGKRSERPAYTGQNERRSFEERDAPRQRPSGDSYERRDDRRGNDRGSFGGDRPNRRESEGRDERRSYGNRDGADNRDRKPYGDRDASRPTSYGNDRDRKPYGDRDAGRPSSYGNDRDRKPYGERAAGSFDKPRSTGERPSTGGTFRERREAMRAATSGPRSSTSYGRADKPKYGEKPGEAPEYKNLKHYENDKTRGNKRRASEEDFGNEELRLNRYIANAGICSRREADALIAAGEIRVNGEVITEMGYKVQPTDTVQYGKTNLNREKLVYVLLNKPKDFITTTDDPEGRKTVMDLVATASKERIFPVGRLDRNTTGLLLFTNDGEVAQKLTHPSHKNKKIYQVELDKPLTAEHLGQITAGLELEDGKAEVDDVAVVAGNPHFVGIELHSGRNRIVRRIFEHLGYDVVTLDRVQYAGLTKKDLPRGKWRYLNEQEVIRLKYFM
ncbi:pseudouridine synthase [Hymenobacter setariae]|uniref:Pseudouridine synthase n=1 Tax=Hymenobacter setariae TaxID=2594794 RepID=A0A558BXJ6_9BACT|nr:pseudouridine synthase [Hymenobacter setariae]TVT41239.1 pseudouridine synthase [Hymenobacter setariae]